MLDFILVTFDDQANRTFREATIQDVLEAQRLYLEYGTEFEVFRKIVATELVKKYKEMITNL